MGKLNIKGGTPVGSASVCESCSYAHIMRGFKESEMLVFCNYALDTIPVPFKLSSCTNHYDKNRPTWKQMEDLAIHVQPATSAKPAGFRLVTLPGTSVAEDEDEEIAEPAIAE